MANWAKLQEELTGLPVAKRAKYGIHFQKGDQIEAHFVGKPCHFQENGIWKPIDTALLATADGWYSSPHSDVIIHPDGRVRVKNSDYQQFTKLPSAKAGKLVGDKIIREFPGGEQWLIMKEDGFREEIHVFKPTFPLEKFIAKTTVNLPSKYKAHPITAEDADGNTYTFTGDVAAFGAWLDKAVYPVVIDPDFGAESGAGGDTKIVGGTGNDIKNFGTTTNTSFGYNYKFLARFDLSSISSSSVCTAATLSRTCAYGWNGEHTWNCYKIMDANGDWVEGTKNNATAGAGEPCWNAKEADGLGGVTTAWAGSVGMGTAGTDYESTSLGSAVGTNVSNDTQFDIPFNAAGLVAVKSYFGAATNNGFLAWTPASDYVNFYMSEFATASYRPKLSVTYVAGGVPKHFMHYQRMRSL